MKQPKRPLGRLQSARKLDLLTSNARKSRTHLRLPRVGEGIGARRFQASSSFAFAGRGKRLPLSGRCLWDGANTTGEKNLAAHRRSNVLSRSRGIMVITKAPGSWSPRSRRAQRAMSFKGSPFDSASRTISAGEVCKSRTYPRPEKRPQPGAG